MDKNPAVHATVPKHKKQERDIWTADTLAQAMRACHDDLLSLAINLAFAGSLRMGELLALTWDCVDITPIAVKEGRAFIFINKEIQRVSKTALAGLDRKDVLFVFPEESKKCTTVRVLKLPKTDSSIRKVYLPGSVAQMLIRRKEEQEEIKSIIGEEYKDYGLVMTTSFGMPYEEETAGGAKHAAPSGQKEKALRHRYRSAFFLKFMVLVPWPVFGTGNGSVSYLIYSPRLHMSGTGEKPSGRS